MCANCGFGTNKVWTFNYHLNRKKPCKRREPESTNHDRGENVNPGVENVNPGVENGKNVNINVKNVNPYECNKCKKNLSSKRSLICHMKVCKGVHSLQCPTCKIWFSSPQSKSRHIRSAKCKFKDDEVDVIRQTMQTQIDELKAALEGKQVTNNIVVNNHHTTTNHTTTTTNNNTTNLTNNLTNTTNTTNLTNIQLNNFDKPYCEHLTKEMVGEMYLKADRELPRMIGEAVRKIYKLPENDTIKFKYGNQAGFANVRQNDEDRILPISEVISTVLSNTTKYCGTKLSECCENGQVRGPNAISHAEELSYLSWTFIPEQQQKRHAYFKYVKSALM